MTAMRTIASAVGFSASQAARVRGVLEKNAIEVKRIEDKGAIEVKRVEVKVAAETSLRQSEDLRNKAEAEAHAAHLLLKLAYHGDYAEYRAAANSKIENSVRPSFLC
jgi:hypothetical protein